MARQVDDATSALRKQCLKSPMGVDIRDRPLSNRARSARTATMNPVNGGVKPGRALPRRPLTDREICQFQRSRIPMDRNSVPTESLANDRAVAPERRNAVPAPKISDLPHVVKVGIRVRRTLDDSTCRTSRRSQSAMSKGKIHGRVYSRAGVGRGVMRVAAWLGRINIASLLSLPPSLPYEQASPTA